MAHRIRSCVEKSHQLARDNRPWHPRQATIYKFHNIHVPMRDARQNIHNRQFYLCLLRVLTTAEWLVYFSAKLHNEERKALVSLVHLPANIRNNFFYCKTVHIKYR